MHNITLSSFVGGLDIEKLPQGSDIDINISYKLDEVLQTLSTYSAKLHVRKNYDSPVLIELSTDDGSIVLADTAPNVILKFTKDKTQGLTVYDGLIYDLEIVSPSNGVSRILEGSFSISREVTK